MINKTFVYFTCFLCVWANVHSAHETVTYIVREVRENHRQMRCFFTANELFVYCPFSYSIPKKISSSTQLFVIFVLSPVFSFLHFQWKTFLSFDIVFVAVGWNSFCKRIHSLSIYIYVKKKIKMDCTIQNFILYAFYAKQFYFLRPQNVCKFYISYTFSCGNKFDEELILWNERKKNGS